MTAESQIKNWIALAEYDFDTADAMLKSGRLLYVVFTCQQCLEKTLKAIYVKQHNVTPPYTHSLIKLVNETSICNVITEKQLKFLDYLSTYYFEGRYTEELDELKSNLSLKTANEIFDTTKTQFQWLKDQMN